MKVSCNVRTLTYYGKMYENYEMLKVFLKDGLHVSWLKRGPTWMSVTSLYVEGEGQGRGKYGEAAGSTAG